jgi:hypothetical protein
VNNRAKVDARTAAMLMASEAAPMVTSKARSVAATTHAAIITPTATSDIVAHALAKAAAAGKYNNGPALQVSAKTEVSAPAVWAAGKYINFTGSASTAGLVATLYVEYLRI